MTATDDKELVAMQTAYKALVTLKTDARVRALQWLAQRLDVGLSTDTLQSLGLQKRSGEGGGKPGNGEQPNPKAFMTQKRPRDFQERIACLAYYLTHYRSMPKFKTLDLTKLNTEAVQPKMSNPAVFARNSVNCQYLSLAGGGAKQITARGEAVVEALPGREAVKKALEDHPLVGHKKKKKKKSTRAL